MSAYARQSARESEIDAVQRLRTVTDPAILRYKAKLHRSFGKYATTPKDTQERIARETGNQTLTDVLYEMRRERS